MDTASKNTVLLENYRYIASLYYEYTVNLSENAKRIEALKEAKGYIELYIKKYNENDLSLHDYNLYAIILYLLLVIDNDNSINKEDLKKQSLENFTKAIKIDNSIAILYSNRSNLFIAMGSQEEAILDLLKAVLLSDEKKYSEKIVNLVKENNTLLDYVVEGIAENRNNISKFKNLVLLLLQLDQDLLDKYPVIKSLLDEL